MDRGSARPPPERSSEKRPRGLETALPAVGLLSLGSHGVEFGGARQPARTLPVAHFALGSRTHRDASDERDALLAQAVNAFTMGDNVVPLTHEISLEVARAQRATRVRSKVRCWRYHR